METLREIRFDDNDIFLKDNIVKTSILPQAAKDLKRNIKIQSNTFFEGGVFGITSKYSTAAACSRARYLRTPSFI